MDECGDREGISGWWGLCHAWAPAAFLEPEPLHAVEMNGQRFEVSDIKALIITAYDDTRAMMLGGRCNRETMEFDDTGRGTFDECRDVNAGAWHVVITNFLGVNNRAFVEDRTAGSQVWNQPLTGYEVTMLEEITVERANELLRTEGEEYQYNDRAETLYEVEMTTDYLTEGSQSREPLGSDGYISHDRYHYILEVDRRGKVIGGEWVGSSHRNHPDFLWVPTAANTSRWSRSNPNVDLVTVRQLIALSRQTEEPTDPTEPTDPVEATHFDNDTEMPLPDNDSNGVVSTLEVDRDITFSSLSVSVNITHTWRGDLLVTVEHGGQTVTLHDRTGGGDDDLVETFTLSDFDDIASSGTWTLRVSDNASADQGTLNNWRVSFVE